MPRAEPYPCGLRQGKDSEARQGQRVSSVGEQYSIGRAMATGSSEGKRGVEQNVADEGVPLAVVVLLHIMVVPRPGDDRRTEHPRPLH